MNLKNASFYKISENSRVQCDLCPHNCLIGTGNTGICRSRKNIDGKLYSLNYGKITSIALDHIEKKPLKRYFPGSLILSVGTYGCNFKCSFCQNWGIAHSEPDSLEVTPEDLVRKAIEFKSDGNIGIAFTYNEPTVWFEYVQETAELAKEHGLKNILVTNGYINLNPLKELMPYINAMNIDVKGFTKPFYNEVCKGALDAVKSVVEYAYDRCHIEITNLIIPNLNDSPDEIEQMSKWLSNLSPEIPLHLTRFFPNYKLKDKPPTPVETLNMAKSIAEKYLKYVYLGNV